MYSLVSESIAETITVRSISVKAVLYVNEIHNHPLPSEVTMKDD